MSDNESVAVAKGETTNEKSEAVDTVVTKKDPRKVEQGKRLAAISREAKERKLRQKIEEELRQNAVDYASYSKYLFPAMTTLGVFTFFYLWGKRGQQTQQQHQEPQQVTQQRQSSPPKKFESF